MRAQFRLAAGELRHSFGVWVAAFLVTFCAGLTGGIPVSLFSTGVVASGTRMLALLSLGSTVAALAILSLVVALRGTLRQIVEARSREIAQWLLLGASPRQVRLLTTGQVLAVSVIGSGAGAAVSVVVAPAFVAYGLRATVGLDGIVPLAGPWWVVVLAICTISAVCALGAGRLAATLDPLAGVEAGSRAQSHQLFPFGAVALVVIAAVMLSGLPGRHRDEASQLLLIGPALVSAAAVSGTRVLAGTERIWTWAVGSAGSFVAIARASAMDASHRSAATVSALTLTIGLPAGLLAGVTALDPVGDDPAPAVALLIVGPTVLALASALSSVSMSARIRDRDGARLRAAGASVSYVRAIGCVEAIIHVVTAAIVVTVVLLATSALESMLLGEPVWSIGGLTVLLGTLASAVAVSAVTLATTWEASAAPVALALRAD